MSTLQNNQTAPIGIFDSGMGGLTVMQSIKRCMPSEKTLYFGDTAHLPYGDKSKETLIKYSLDIVDFFLKQKAKAIVVACNSATSNAWDEIIKRVDNQALVFNVIDPVINKVAYELHSNIGIIATQATINSKFYNKKIKKLNKHIQVSSLATPLLVPIIEEGLVKSEIAKVTIEHYLTNKSLRHIDSLILGCTHYPIIYNQINNFYQGKVNIINSPLIIAHDIKHQLNKHNLLNEQPGFKEDLFYVSDYTKNFETMAKNFFGKKINLEQLSL
ncbi:MAG: glutamate racemase [Flavobacteriales bacterium]